MRARNECDKAARELERSVHMVAVVLSKWPDEVWDEFDHESIAPTLDAYVRLQGNDPDAPPAGPDGKPRAAQEPLNELDRALIARERARIAALKAEGKW